MNLDVRTLYIAVLLTYLVFGLFQVTMWQQRRADGAFLHWGISNLACGLGALLVILRKVAPDWASITLANALLVLGYTLMWAGLRRFARESVNWVIVAAAPLGLILLYELVPSVGESLPARICVLSFTIATLSALCMRDARRAQAAEYLATRSVAVAVFGLCFLTAVLRAGFTAFGASTGSEPMPSGMIQSVAALNSVLTVLLWNLAVMLIAGERLENRLKQAANNDALTGVLNRAGFRQLSARQIERCRISGEPASVLLLDLDHFKAVNDRYGHDAGDQLLQVFASKARQVTRASDLLARYGGEEFCVLLAGAGEGEATQIAQRLRAEFEAASFETSQGVCRTTVSVGLAEIRLPGESVDQALARADRALYAAKAQGRNRVCSAEDVAAEAVPVTT